MSEYIRDIIAIAAMHAELSANSGIIRGVPDPEKVAERSYEFAEAMIKERDKRK